MNLISPVIIRTILSEVGQLVSAQDHHTALQSIKYLKEILTGVEKALLQDLEERN